MLMLQFKEVNFLIKEFLRNHLILNIVVEETKVF